MYILGRISGKPSSSTAPEASPGISVITYLGRYLPTPICEQQTLRPLRQRELNAPTYLNFLAAVQDRSPGIDGERGTKSGPDTGDC